MSDITKQDLRDMKTDLINDIKQEIYPVKQKSDITEKFVIEFAKEFKDFRNDLYNPKDGVLVKMSNHIAESEVRTKQYETVAKEAAENKRSSKRLRVMSFFGFLSSGIAFITLMWDKLWGK